MAETPSSTRRVVDVPEGSWIRCEGCSAMVYRRLLEENLSVCPECEEESLHRVYRPVGIVFKGSGFYATDNRSPSGQKTERSKDEAPKSETKSEEKKSSEPAKKESKKSKD